MLKKRKNMLDDLDKRILRYLQNDPESSVAKLAEEAATTPSVVSRRLATLQESGYVLRFRCWRWSHWYYRNYL